MAPCNGHRVASRYLVCASCISWIQFDSPGCDTALAETRGVASLLLPWGAGRWISYLVRELAELREMLVGIKRTVTGHGLEEKGGETGDREVGLEEHTGTRRDEQRGQGRNNSDS